MEINGDNDSCISLLRTQAQHLYSALSSSSILIRVAAFKVLKKPALISLPTRDIADFAYLLFFDSGGMSLMTLMSLRYV